MRRSNEFFFVGANSDSFDMRMMQYTLARRMDNASEGGAAAWSDLLTRLGVVGTIDTTRLVPSFKIIDGLTGKTGRSVSNMHQLILGRPLVGAHRAGDDVDGVVSILCEAKITKKIMEVPSAIPLGSWLKHSNHSKARLNWEAKMKAEIEAEKAGEVAAGGMVDPAIDIIGGADEDSDSGGESDGGESDASDEFIAEEIVDHIGSNSKRKYVVRWQGCRDDDTSEEPAQRFGEILPLELLEAYLVANPDAKCGHPKKAVALRNS